MRISQEMKEIPLLHINMFGIAELDNHSYHKL